MMLPNNSWLQEEELKQSVYRVRNDRKKVGAALTQLENSFHKRKIPSTVYFKKRESFENHLEEYDDYLDKAQRYMKDKPAAHHPSFVKESCLIGLSLFLIFLVYLLVPGNITGAEIVGIMPDELVVSTEGPSVEVSVTPLIEEHEPSPEEMMLDTTEQTAPPEQNLIGTSGLIPVQAEANSTSCGSVNGDLTLTSYVNSSGTCLTINASNIILDCSGFVVNYSQGNIKGYGVNNSGGYDNITIRNCDIQEGSSTTSSRHGIYFSGVDNATVTNNNLSVLGTSAVGIYLTGSVSNVVIGNRVNNTEDSSSFMDGIALWSGSNYNNLTNNILYTVGGGEGIELGTSSTFNIMTNNTILAGGIDIGNSKNNSLFNNTITGDVSLTGSGGSIMSGNAITSGDLIPSTGGHSINTNNTINGLPIIYNDSVSNQVIFEDVDLRTTYSKLICGSCVNVTYDNITIGNYGIHFVNTNSSTIKNSNITTSNADGIHVYYGDNSNNITNNWINISGTSKQGIDVAGSSNNIKGNIIIVEGTTTHGIDDDGTSTQINNNNITGTGSSVTGIYITSASSLIAENNIVISTIYGISIATGSSTTVRNNVINTSGSGAIGVYFSSSSSSNTIDSNTITTTHATNAYGISLTGTSTSNVLLNNNISTVTATRINDTTGDGDVNYLVYNNSFGEIRWTDRSSGGFLEDMDVSNANIGLGINLFIGNNTAALNTSAFSQEINSSANITFYNLPFVSVTQIYKHPNYTTNATEIQTSGTDCLGSTCTELNFTLLNPAFNTTSFSSFSVNGTAANNVSNTTVVVVNASSANNDTNDDLYCWATGEDGEQTNLQAYYTWYKDGTAYVSGSTSVSNNTLTLLNTIDGTETYSGQNWTCSVLMYDGLINESDRNNASIVLAALACGNTIASDVLTTDLVNCSGNGINIQTGNVTFDCNYHSIQGTGSSNGIYINNSNNVTVQNCNISNFYSGNGISIHNSSNVTVKNSNISSVYSGIIYNDTSNIPFWKTGNNYSNNIIQNTTYGIYAIDQGRGWIDSNKISNGSRGIYLDVSSRIAVKNNTLYNNTYGIYTTNAGNNNYTNNNLSRNTIGGYLSGSDNNLSYNNIYDNSNHNLEGSSSVIEAENNWWGYTDCQNISSNLSGTIDYQPFLNAPYPNGVSTSCSALACGSIIENSINLTENLTGCTDIGLSAGASNSVIDCKGYTISGIANDLNEKGIQIQQNIDNVTIKNCIITGFYEGIYLGSVTHYHQFINNTINGNNKGIYFVVGGTNLFQNFTIRGNNITNNTDGITGTGSRLKFENNSVINNRDSGYEIQFHDSNFTNEHVAHNRYGIYINSPTELDYNNFFRDSTFENNTLDLNIVKGPYSNITFINTSINKSALYVLGDAKAVFKWYVDVNVTDSAGNVLESATVNSYNSLNELDDTILSAAAGIARVALTEFVRSSETNWYVIPGTVTASKGNYTQNSTSVNVYNATYATANLTLTKFSCGSTLYADTELGNSFSCSGDGLTISADGITIDGKGFNLTGSGSGTGINTNGKDNINIINLNITSFATGISIANTDNSNFTNLDVVSNTRGIMFNDSDNNIIFDSIFTSNTDYGVGATSTSETSNSLVNSTINVNDISVSSAAQVYRKWYVDVNSTYNNGNTLQSANATGYFNNTQVKDYSLLTGSDGIAKLILAELKKNATNIYYLTPHLINASFSSSSGSDSNSTTVNLTQTNNTNVNLGLTLDCTSSSSPSAYLYVNNNTVLCPSNLKSRGIIINNSNLTLTCDKTIIETGIYNWYNRIAVDSQENVTVVGCTIQPSSSWGVYVYNATNITVLNTTFLRGTSGGGVYCSHSTKMLLNNSYSAANTPITIRDCNNSQIFNNTFEGGNTNFIYKSFNNIFRNNTFNNMGTALYFYTASDNNTFYHNNFSDNTLNVYYYNDLNSEYKNYFNTTINVSGNMQGQGNEWSDYCDKGVDLNSDGYADNVSSAGNDWPYSENISTRISDVTTNNKGVIDYAPKIIACPAEDVFLGSSTTGGGGSTTTVAAIVPVVETPVTEVISSSGITAPSSGEEEGDTYTAEEASKFLKVEDVEQEKISEEITQFTIVLENTGTKKMHLFSELSQEMKEPFYIVKTKTLGGESSRFSRMLPISYSSEPIAGRLLKAEILNPEEIVLKPGERIEKIVKIKEGLVTPRQMKIQFTTLGQVVLEKEVAIEKKIVSGTAIDQDKEQNLLDVYALLLPEQLAQRIEETNTITGMAVADTSLVGDDYLLELNVNKKGSGTVFSDIYGPYTLKEEQVFIFAQQFKYRPEAFTGGSHIIHTTIYRGNAVIVENEFEIELGEEKEKMMVEKFLALSWAWILVLMLLFSISTGYYCYRTSTKSPIVIPPKRIKTLDLFFLLREYWKGLLFGVGGIAGTTAFIVAIIYYWKPITSYLSHLGVWWVPLIAFMIMVGLTILLSLISLKKEKNMEKLPWPILFSNQARQKK